jgi:AAHS family 4-hydroxybenzoate transporter-like MFS transporter
MNDPSGPAGGKETADGPQFDGQVARLILFGWAALIADGYNYTSVAFATPSIASEWGVPTSSFGLALSASLAGILIGAPFGGWLGDRYGRRPALVAANLWFGLLSLATLGVHDQVGLAGLRLLTGLGLGGVTPNVFSLVAEQAPARWRAGLVTAMTSGILLGSSLPGFVKALAGPAFQWREIFLVGGVLPLLAAAGVALLFPESSRHLALRHRTRAPGGKPASAGTGGPRPRLVPSLLFSQGLETITPLLWGVTISFSVSSFFLVSWLPIVFRLSGGTTGNADLLAALYTFGGAAGIVVISLLLHALGMLSIAAFLAGSVIGVAALGAPGLDGAALEAVVFAMGACVYAVQSGLNVAPSLIYPTAFRATGIGWAFGASRIGAICGAYAGGSLLALHLDGRQLFLLAALPVFVSLVGTLILSALCHRRFRSHSLGDIDLESRHFAQDLVPSGGSRHGGKAGGGIPDSRPSSTSSLQRTLVKS